MKKSKDTDFFDLVCDLVCEIPEGRVSTYGAIAKALGSARGARMVGWILGNRADHSKVIPAHRVVNSSGVLTGKFHFKHPEQMAELLNKEGIKVHNDKVMNFKQLFWDPLSEL